MMIVASRSVASSACYKRLKVGWEATRQAQRCDEGLEGGLGVAMDYTYAMTCFVMVKAKGNL